MEPFNPSLVRPWYFFPPAPDDAPSSRGRRTRSDESATVMPWAGIDPVRDGAELATGADRTDIDRLRAGDVEAFRTLFHRHYQELVAQAYRYVRRHAVAEELVQETLLQVWIRREQLPNTLKPRAYLYASVRHAAMNVVRRETLDARHRDEQLRDAGEDAGLGASPLGVIESAEALTQLDTAITHLPPRLRDVVELRWKRQLKVADVATILGVTPKAVETYITRAVKALRAILADHA